MLAESVVELQGGPRECFFDLSLDANDLGQARSGLGQVGAVGDVRAGALGLAGHVTHEIGRAAVADDLAVINTLEGLSVHRVTESSDGGNLGAVDRVEGVVDDHGALGVTTEDDLGVGALLKSLVGESGHLGTAGGAHVCVASSISWVINTLHGARASVLDQILSKTGANNGAESAHFSGTSKMLGFKS